jgi:hypothetical protein
MCKRVIYIDGIEVDKLLNSKEEYSWFLMKDKTIKRVGTCDYDQSIAKNGDYFLVSK